MAKTTKPMIKLTVITYLPQPDVMDAESFKAVHDKIQNIRDAVNENTTEVQKFDAVPVNRQYEIEPAATEPSQKDQEPRANCAEKGAPESLIGSSVQPASWAAEQGTVLLGDVVQKARLKASMTPEEWNEQDESAREALIADMVEEMGLKPEDAE